MILFKKLIPLPEMETGNKANIRIKKTIHNQQIVIVNCNITYKYNIMALQ